MTFFSHWGQNSASGSEGPGHCETWVQSCWSQPAPKVSHLETKNAKLPRSLTRGTQRHHEYPMGWILRANQCSAQVGSEEVLRVWTVSGAADDLKNNWDRAMERQMQCTLERVEEAWVQCWELALSMGVTSDLWFEGRQEKRFPLSSPPHFVAFGCSLLGIKEPGGHVSQLGCLNNKHR